MNIAKLNQCEIESVSGGDLDPVAVGNFVGSLVGCLAAGYWIVHSTVARRTEGYRTMGSVKKLATTAGVFFSKANLKTSGVIAGSVAGVSLVFAAIGAMF